MAEYYKLSGRFDPLGALVSLATGLVAALILGTIYAYLHVYLNYLIFSCIMVWFYGYVLGRSMARAIRWGRVRNQLVSGFLGLLVGVFGLYVAWVVYIFAASEHSFLVLSPGGVLLVARSALEEGVWTIFNQTPKGWFLATLWGVEAFIIVATTAGIAYDSPLEAPFCEGCGAWMEHHAVLGWFEPDCQHQQLRENLERGEAGVSELLEPLNEERQRLVEVFVEACPRCWRQNLLSLSERTLEANGNGGMIPRYRPLLKRVVVPIEVVTALKSRFKEAQKNQPSS